MPESRVQTNLQLFRRLCAPWTNHGSCAHWNTIETLRPELWWWTSLNHQRPNTIIYFKIHLAGPSTHRRCVQGVRVNLITVRLRILRALDVFFFTIQYSLLYHKSGLSLDSTILTLQELIFFALLLHGESPHMTRCYIDEGNKVPCPTHRRHIHESDLKVIHWSWSNFHMSARRHALVCHCYLDTLESII